MSTYHADTIRAITRLANVHAGHLAISDVHEHPIPEAHLPADGRTTCLGFVLNNRDVVPLYLSVAAVLGAEVALALYAQRKSEPVPLSSRRVIYFPGTSVTPDARSGGGQ